MNCNEGAVNGKEYEPARIVCTQHMLKCMQQAIREEIALSSLTVKFYY